MRYLLIILLLPQLLQARPGEFVRPDYAAIEKAVNNKNSVYYRPALLARFVKEDTTLTADEYKYLYFGSFFVKNDGGEMADIEKNSEARKERNLLMQKERPDSTDIQRMLVLTNSILQSNPVNLKELDLKYRILRAQHNTAAVNILESQIKALVHTIMATGDGKTCETSFHIASVGDEYFMLQAVFDLQFTSQTLTNDMCDYLAVKSNNANVAGLYFNASQLMAQLSKSFSPDMFKDLVEGEKSKKKKK